MKRFRIDILESLSSTRQLEVKAWEEEITACEHTLVFEQYATGSTPGEGMHFSHLAYTRKSNFHTSGLACCASCALTSNLWLCLTCGALGCGRPQYGGTGGNGHALKHYETTQHPLCVKLGTITPEGGGGLYFSFMRI